MIASTRQAPRHGPGKLVVDGVDEGLVRTARFAVKPSTSQAGRLHGLVRICREVYNAALQHRRDAWRAAGVSISWQDQFTALSGAREVRPDAFAWGIQPLRATIKRVDDAMQGFFRRVADGGAPGYPRFKGAGRFRTVCYDEPVSWKVDVAAGTLYLQGVGTIRLGKSARRQLRRLAARGGTPTALRLTRRRAGPKHLNRWSWRAAVVFAGVAPERSEPARPERVTGADRGVALALATADHHADDAGSDGAGELLAMPRYAAATRERIAELERARARKRVGSREHRRLGAQIARARRKAADQADNWARQAAKDLVADSGTVALEDLNLTGMSASAKGTVEAPGRNVAAKQGLNRGLQDAALGKLAYRICVKAENAGRRVWLVDPRYSSQTCARCGHCRRANRRSRARFVCRRCGHAAHADANAAAVIAARGADCEAAWADAGRPPLARRGPRNAPHKKRKQTTRAAA